MIPKIDMKIESMIGGFEAVFLNDTGECIRVSLRGSNLSGGQLDRAAKKIGELREIFNEERTVAMMTEGGLR
jgi:hypothetical protein